MDGEHYFFFDYALQYDRDSSKTIFIQHQNICFKFTFMTSHVIGHNYLLIFLKNSKIVLEIL